MEIITSRQNPLCTHLRKLAASASYRRQRGEFLCDSPKLLKEALLWGAEELSALLKKSGIPLYGAALREDTLDARAVDYNRCAIAIGSEGRGLTEGVLALCDRTIKIPMSEHCESLNAAAAATVLLWEAARND